MKSFRTRGTSPQLRWLVPPLPIGLQMSKSFWSAVATVPLTRVIRPSRSPGLRSLSVEPQPARTTSVPTKATVDLPISAECTTRGGAVPAMHHRAMPRARSVCGVPGCPHPAVHEGLCARHRRIRGRPWQRLRRQVLERAQHRCDHCGPADVSLQVHHLRPLSAVGPELPPIDQLLALCADRHRARQGVIPCV